MVAKEAVRGLRGRARPGRDSRFPMAQKQVRNPREAVRVIRRRRSRREERAGGRREGGARGRTSRAGQASPVTPPSSPLGGAENEQWCW